MKNQRHFSLLLIVAWIYCAISCHSKKNVPADLLPKDISLMPIKKKVEESSLEEEARKLRILDEQIRTLATNKYCTSAEEWRISPYGSKPCGGPNEYLAYHIDVEEEIIPMIQDFTRREAHYNILAGLTSDCALEPQPSDIVCKNGKAELVYTDEITEK